MHFGGRVHPEILERTIERAGYVTVERMRIRLADGAEVWREMERHGDSVAVLPYDEQRRVALVARQFRAPVFAMAGETILEEACAGMIDGEDAPATARREAFEELGVRLGELELLATVWPGPGVGAERQTLFLARYGADDRDGAGGGLESENEGIEVLERPLRDLAADADLGLIADGKLFTLVTALRLRRPDLFG
jgi:nudix-type nucleoside diphosphatase (YffH/AdpP family)